MKCPVCQYDLPGGVGFCPNCGTPVPSDPYGRPASSPNQGIPPTVMASPTPPPSPYGMPPASDPYGMPPSTNYGAPSDPYAPPPPANPYGAPQQPYGAPQQAPYGMPGAFQPQQPPKKSNRGCVIAIVSVLVVLVLIIGGIVALVSYGANRASQAISNAQATLTAIPTIDFGTTPTATTGSSGSGVPNAGQIDANAKANITSVQTSLGMDSNYKPTHIKTSFSTGDEVDITFTLAGNSGYAIAKIYRDGSFDIQSDSPLTVQSGFTNGAFPLTVNNAGAYVAGLYWCQKSDCSDAALAQVASFTVS